MNKSRHRRFLVTGGTGFVGAALVRRLIADGHSVIVVDNNWRGQAGRLADVASAVRFVEADIRDGAAVDGAFEQIDCVVHLAFVNGTRYFYEQPELVLDVGVRGMLNVLDSCRRHGVKDLVVASSSEVYQTPPRVPTDETVPLTIPDPLNPRYSYAGGKIISELLAINCGRSGFERVCIFRPHNVYGPDMGWEHVIPEFALRAAAATAATPDGQVPFQIQGDGTQTRAFIHIDDFVEGLVRVINQGKHLEIYNIGNPEEVSISELARMVVACLGREALIVPGESPPGETTRRCPDIGKLRSLGFEPQVTLRAGLSAVVDWYVQNASRAAQEELEAR